MIDTVIHNDALTVLRGMADNSVDAIVSDPPAGIGFMNKEFDHDKGGRDHWIAWLKEIMVEAKRVIKPGGHALIWALPRTSHWTATALEDAGFEVRDKLYHLFGSGFPKSLDIGKAIDRRRKDECEHVRVFLKVARDKAGLGNRQVAEHFGFTSTMASHWIDHPTQPTVPTWEQWLELKSLLAFSEEMDAEVWRLNGRKGKPGDAWYEREVVGHSENGQGQGWAKQGLAGFKPDFDITKPATPEAQRWQGWGSATKPAVEEWILCRKPLSENSIAANVLKWHTGAINIDATRVGAISEPVEWCECEEGDDDL